jgi:23S rRNA-/tRNA-specific pseudouridylate synthase
LLNSHDKFVLLKIVPKTGRMHQIRIHLAKEKLPIVGDDKYGDFSINKIFKANKKNTMFLHAHKLSFFHPITNKRLKLSAPIPKIYNLIFKNLLI